MTYGALAGTARDRLGAVGYPVVLWTLAGTAVSLVTGLVEPMKAAGAGAVVGGVFGFFKYRAPEEETALAGPNLVRKAAEMEKELDKLKIALGVAVVLGAGWAFYRTKPWK